MSISDQVTNDDEFSDSNDSTDSSDAYVVVAGGNSDNETIADDNDDVLDHQQHLQDHDIKKSPEQSTNNQSSFESPLSPTLSSVTNDDPHTSASRRRPSARKKMTKMEKQEARARARRWSDNRTFTRNNTNTREETATVTHEQKKNKVMMNSLANDTVTMMENDCTFLRIDHDNDNDNDNNNCKSIIRDPQKQQRNVIHQSLQYISTLGTCIKNQEWTTRPITITLPLWSVVFIGILLLATFIAVVVLLGTSLLLFGMMVGMFGCRIWGGVVR